MSTTFDLLLLLQYHVQSIPRDPRDHSFFSAIAIATATVDWLIWSIDWFTFYHLSIATIGEVHRSFLVRKNLAKRLLLGLLPYRLPCWLLGVSSILSIENWGRGQSRYPIWSRPSKMFSEHDLRSIMDTDLQPVRQFLGNALRLKAQVHPSFCNICS